MKKFLAVALSVMLLVSCTATMAGAVSLDSAEALGMLEGVHEYMSGCTEAQRLRIYDLLNVYASTDVGLDILIGLVDGERNDALISGYIDSFGVTDSEKTSLKVLLTFFKCVPEEIRSKAVNDLHDRVAYEGYDESADYAEGTAALRSYLFGDTISETDGLTDPVFYQLLSNLGDLVVLTADPEDEACNYEFLTFTNEEFKNNIETILLPAFPELNGTEVISAEHFMGIFCDVVNEDEGITPEMKGNIAETLGEVTSFEYGSAITAVEISATGSLSQTAGSTTPVTIDLTATKVNDEAVIAPAIEWYINDTLVQYTGETFVFVPETAGTYKIKAVCDGIESNVIKVTVSSTGTVVKPSVGGGSGGAGSSGTGSTTQEPVEPAKPNKYPVIPAPSKISFVTMNNSTSAISEKVVTFDDVQAHWAKDYIELLATAGFLRGHSATNFEPNLGVTREEMHVILARVLGVDSQKAAAPVAFADHDKIQSYAVDAVYKLAEMGVYKGYDDGTFAPQQVLTREEISALFSRVLGKAALVENKTFVDQSAIAEWFAEDVENLVNYGVISGYPDETFRPQNNVTRGEAAVMMYNTLYRMGIVTAGIIK